MNLDVGHQIKSLRIPKASVGKDLLHCIKLMSLFWFIEVYSYCVVNYLLRYMSVSVDC